MTRTSHRHIAAGRRKQSGLGLMELLVVILISLLMLAGLFSIVYGTRQNYLAQNQLAQLQDSERLAMNLIASIVQTGGYFPNPTLNTLVGSLPAAGNFAAAGQAYFGQTVAGNDQLYVRYVAGTNDGVMDCNGNTNGTGASLIDINYF
ncbi:MAG TPA: prepilin-type N-terminal cleavage/methylation domain-containing protein, partial [Burkholderiaceae bacterium]|nr:prepilin-type N-terminal cleavage/methylation domain-containing protein [Burkholderiaceae bacterium]